jgi:hypothetical protein
MSTGMQIDLYDTISSAASKRSSYLAFMISQISRGRDGLGVDKVAFTSCDADEEDGQVDHCTSP